MLSVDQPVSVRTGEELDTGRLNQYLAQVNPAIGPVVSVAQFPGGYSNLTYFLRADAAEYVLRRPPAGAKAIKGGHDMGREFRILSALQQTGYHKIPAPLLYCDDEAVLGYPFYIMERVEGVILRAHQARQLAQTLTADTMRHLSEALCDNLAELHAIDIEATGLIQIGKPDGYVQRQVEGWYKRYQAAQTDEIAVMDELAHWLQQHVPAGQAPTLIHNDYKYDNVVLDAQNLTHIKAVLDWEMTTVGDPLMDLGTTLSYWAEATDQDFEKGFNLSWLPGNLTRQAFADRYAAKSGRDVSGILYYYVFGLFKNSVVLQQIYSRYKKGLTSDPRFAGLLMGVRALSDKARRSLDAQQMR